MTIKNLFALILKLIGFFFFIETLTSFIPEQINLLINFDVIFPKEIRSQNISSYLIISIATMLIILLLIYYFFIVKTELLLKFLQIEKHFGDTRIENLAIPIQKYTQISIIVISVILLIFQLPIFINTTIKYFGVKDSFQEGLTSDLISSIIIILLSFIGIIFSDTLSKKITK